MASSKDESNCIGRRGFIKSLFGLGATVVEKTDAKAKPAGSKCLLWVDLNTGFVGFPSGLNLPKGQPGSVMKLVAASAAVEKGLLNPNEKVDCKGHATIGGETFHCQFPHGHVDLTRAIAFSCNVYFIQAARSISTPAFLEFARRLGLNEPVARFASGAFPGQTHDHDPSYTFVLGLNPSLAPTALQLLRLAALIATKGQLPYLRRSDDTEQGQPFHAELSEATWHRLQQGMELACREGTAHRLDPENHLHVAAKTGTSMHGKKFQSCIIGFFPYDKPRHAFCVWAPSGTSQESAVPEARAFLFSTTWP